MKKLVLSTVSAFLLLLVLAGAVLAAPKSASEREKFKGTLQAVEVDNAVDFPIVHVTATGSGKASQLGKFTYGYTVDIHIIGDPANGIGVGTLYYTFVAANGDKLYSVGQGYGSPAPGLANTNRVVEQHVITGGTGRFVGATGKFTVDRLITSDLHTSGTIDGYIVLVDR